ncbi:MAG: hypothetical protein JXA30_13165 [Deltaproteobacteria bacterium]|nr:hypothetical protein [Deltaproteobacteria bacterium]
MTIRGYLIILALSICTLSCISRGDTSDAAGDGKSDASRFDAESPAEHLTPEEIPIDASDDTAQATCGNGVVDDNEQCDGEKSLKGMSCEALGYFGGGQLACDPRTCTYDTRLCSLSPTCGNGELERNEQCESGVFREIKCSEFNQAYTDGYVTCDFGTCTFDLSGCNTKSECGNGILEGSEQCDGDELNNMTCVDLDYGFSEGELRCDPDTCTFDISDCEFSKSCGNGVVEPGEQCDGYVTSETSCSSLGFFSGTLSCSSDCRFDTSDCVSTTSGSACFRGGDPRHCVYPPPADD